MKIMVTGGAGFIGSALCHYLAGEAGEAVVNVDALTYASNLHSLAALDGHPAYDFVKADICDAAAMADVFKRYQPDAVMHLAAESHVDRSITGAGDFIRTNIVGTYTLLEAARRYWESLPGARQESFRFLQVSTDEVYGSLGPEGLFSETTPYDPSSPYSASKAASDHLALAWHRTYDFPALISNCSNNYGPRQFPEKLIPLMVINALHGKPLPVYGDGSNIRDWLYVEDHVRALHLILREGRLGEKYNAGGRNERTNLQVVQSICDLLDQMRPAGRPRRELIRFVPDRPGHDARYAIDPSRIRDELGWRISVTVEEGLERTVRWYLDNEAWWRPLLARKGVGQRLGIGEDAP